MSCGGFSTCNQPQDYPEAAELLEIHKHEIAAKLRIKPDSMTFEGARLQVVAGKNYRIFFFAEGKNYRAMIWRKLDMTSEVKEVTCLS